jgi:hypothetical protein
VVVWLCHNTGSVLWGEGYGALFKARPLFTAPQLANSAEEEKML